jgi:hypothetical protein
MKIHWISANTLIQAQTQQIADEFKTSRPRPRNRAMGFKGRDIHKWIQVWPENGKGDIRWF